MCAHSETEIGENTVYGMNEEEYVDFLTAIDTNEVIPVIRALREKFMHQQEGAVRTIKNKCPHLTDKEMQLISNHLKFLTNQVLRDPILRLKEMSEQHDSKLAVDLLVEMYALEGR